MYLDFLTHDAAAHPNADEEEDENFDLDDLIRQAEENPSLWEPVVDDGPGN